MQYLKRPIPKGLREYLKRPIPKTLNETIEQAFAEAGVRDPKAIRMFKTELKNYFAQKFAALYLSPIALVRNTSAKVWNEVFHE